MKLLVNVLIAQLLVWGAFSSVAQDLIVKGKNVALTNVKLVTTDNKSVSFNDYKGKNGTLVIFSCNTCPFVIGKASGFEGWEKDYNNITALAKAKGFGVVIVNANEAQRKDSDSPEKMDEHAKMNRYMAPYVIDQGHVLADVLDAKTTPHIYLFDKENKLMYTGAIDNSYDPKATVVENYLVDALNNWDKGQELKDSKAVGCSIKRVEK